jgi:hypothetical protein
MLGILFQAIHLRVSLDLEVGYSAFCSCIHSFIHSLVT